MRHKVLHFDLADHASSNARSYALDQNPSSDGLATLHSHNGIQQITTSLNGKGLQSIIDAVLILNTMWGFVTYDDDVDSFLWTDLEDCRSEKDPFLVSLDKVFESSSPDKPNKHLLKRSSGITLLTLLKADVRPGDPIVVAVKRPMYERFRGLIHEMAESGCQKIISGIIPAVIVCAPGK